MALFYSLFAFIFLLTVTPHHSSAAEPTPPVKTLNPAIKVQDLTSPKGQRAWIVEHHHSKVISLSLLFRDAGSKSDPHNKEGRAQIAAALFDEGAGDYSMQQLKHKFLENKLQWNVACGKDVLEISLRFPAENLEAVAQLLKLALTKPHYQQEALDRNRNEILTTISQSLHEDNVVAHMTRDELVYGQHPYSRTPKDTLIALPKLTLEDIKTYRAERFGRDHIEIVAVGDVTPHSFLTLLDDVFSDLPAQSTPLDIKDVSLTNLGQEKIVTMDIPQSFIFYLQPGIPRLDPDFIPATLMARILGSGAWESRLWNEVREKRGLAYHIDLGLHTHDHVNLLIGQAGSKNESAMQVIELIRAAWQEIYEHGITQKELDLAKDYALGSFVLHFDSTANICKTLAHLQHAKLPSTYVNERNSLVANVTLDDINRVVNRLIKPQELTFIVAGNPQQNTATKKDQST